MNWAGQGGGGPSAALWPTEGTMSRGLYEKFRVERTDGRSAPGEKHHGCRYFILDLDHDQHAAAALKAYAESCKATEPRLAEDLHHIACVGVKGFDLALERDAVEQNILARFAQRGGDDE